MTTDTTTPGERLRWYLDGGRLDAPDGPTADYVAAAVAAALDGVLTAGRLLTTPRQPDGTIDDDVTLTLNEAERDLRWAADDDADAADAIDRLRRNIINGDRAAMIADYVMPVGPPTIGTVVRWELTTGGPTVTVFNVPGIGWIVYGHAQGVSYVGAATPRVAYALDRLVDVEALRGDHP